VGGRGRSSRRSSLIESSLFLAVDVLERGRRFLRTRGVDFDEIDSNLEVKKRRAVSVRIPGPREEEDQLTSRSE